MDPYSWSWNPEALVVVPLDVDGAVVELGGAVASGGALVGNGAAFFFACFFFALLLVLSSVGRSATPPAPSPRQMCASTRR